MRLDKIEVAERLFETFPPPPSVKQEFLENLHKTSRPEDFPGLSWTKPPNNLSGSQMIADFDVSRNARNNDLIPCSNCKNAKKFLGGALIWSPDQRIRIIGHDCAEKTDRDTYQRMRNTYAPFSKNAGSASALLGFLQLGAGALISTVVGAFGAGGSFAVIAILAVTSALGLAILLVGRGVAARAAAIE